jgi:transcription antitermination factor NusG
MYLPLYAVRVRDRVHRTLTRIVHRPLFTGYLLVILGPTDAWTPITNTQGVARLLMSEAEKPHVVRAGAVEALQRFDASRATPDATRRLLAPLEPGADDG